VGAGAADALAAGGPAVIDAAMARRLWLQVEGEVRSKRRPLAAMLGGAMAHPNSGGDGLIIELPPESGFNKTMLEKADNIDVIRSIMARIYGAPVKLQYSLGAPGAGAGNAGASQQPAAGNDSTSGQTSVREAYRVPVQPESGRRSASAPTGAYGTGAVAVGESGTAEVGEAVPLENYEDILASTFGTPIIFEEI
jgi:hypothetical protein